MIDKLETSLSDLRIELAQVKERLAQEISEHNQTKEQFYLLTSTVDKRVADQTRALTTLYKIMLATNQAESLEMLLDEALALATSILQCNTGIVIVFEEDPGQTQFCKARVIVERNDHGGMPHKKGSWLVNSTLLAELIAKPEPLLIANTEQDTRIPEAMRSLAARLMLFPIMFADQIQGVVGLMRPAGPEPTEDEMSLFSTIINQMGVAIHQLELRMQAQKGRLLAERERLGRDLHDTITQSLYGLATLSEAGSSQLEANNPEAASRIFKRIGQLSRQALREMRLFIHELRPNILEQNGLVAALQMRLDAVEGRTDLRSRLVAEEEFQLPPEVETALYRIALEALNNTMRHSGASQVDISLRRAANEVVLVVTDNGCGFDPEGAANGGMGLDNMRIYASEIGTQVEVCSDAALGTTVRVAVAIEEVL